MDRAERRHRRQRKVEKAKRKLRQWGNDWADRASWWADNMAKCSCHGCTAPTKVEIDDNIEHWMDWYRESKG